MAKSSKSATAGTRKKHAKKAADDNPDGQPTKEKKAKGKDRGKKNKEPRQKVYVAPVKPAPIQPDPLDTTGLVHQLPPDLLVILRRLGKKDAVTKRRALEELQRGWVEKAGKDEDTTASVILMLPVWMHHVSALLLHTSRRIRLLSADLHASLLQVQTVRDQVFFFLREAASVEQVESILGTWCMAAHDVDRAVSASASKSWALSVSSGQLELDETSLPSLVLFLQRALLDPMSVYLALNPAPPVYVPPTKGKSGPTPAVKKEDTELAAKLRADGEEEGEADRSARLRIGAFGAIKWAIDTRKEGGSTQFVEFLANPVIWTALYHAETAPWSPDSPSAYGNLQPNVRKSAWVLLTTIMKGHGQEPMDSLVDVLSIAVLRSAWVEPDPNVRAIMWTPLLTFLREYPTAWEKDAASVFVASAVENEEDDEEDDEEDEEESGDEDEDAPAPVRNVKAPPARPLSAYEQFLRFLESGCSGSLSQGYPTVVIILSTLPPSVLASSSTTPLATLMASFWGAVDGNALTSLDRANVSGSFLSSVLECMVLLVRRLQGKHAGLLSTGSSETEVDGLAEAKALVQQRFTQVWTELVDENLKAEPRAASGCIARTLKSLSEINEELFQAAWDTLSNLIINSESKSATSANLVAAALKVFEATFPEGSLPQCSTRTLFAKVVAASTATCDKALSSSDEPESPSAAVISLSSLLAEFREGLFASPELAEGIDNMMTTHAYRFLCEFPAFLLTYMRLRRDEARCQDLWHSLLLVVSQHPSTASRDLAPLLDHAHKRLLPKHLKPKDQELDSLVGVLVAKALLEDSSSSSLTLVRQLFKSSELFLSTSGMEGLLQSVVSAFKTQVDFALKDISIPAASFDAPLDLIQTVFTQSPSLSLAPEYSDLLEDLFVFGYLVAGNYSEGVQVASGVKVARGLWGAWIARASPDALESTSSCIKKRLGHLLCSTQVHAKPADVIKVVLGHPPGIDFDLVNDLYPVRGEIEAMLEELSPDPSDPSLAVLDASVPPASVFGDKGRKPPSSGYDVRGYSQYARVVGSLLDIFTSDRGLGRENFWLLRHFLALAVYANDYLRSPSLQSPAFGPSVSSASLQDISAKAQQLATYLLTSSEDDSWRARAVAAVLTDKPGGSSGSLEIFLVDLIQLARRGETIRETRILRSVLQHVIGNAGKEEADQWMVLARKIEKTAPETSMAIVSAVTEYAPEPPKLDRYRNELAADMLGIPASKANSQGLFLLRRLAATAPDPESDVVFLPQPRAVNVMKACQQWVNSGDDIDEEVESAMTLIFLHLAPIVQNVPGSHWGLVFDVIENNLENCSFRETETLVALKRTLQLIISMQDLCTTNKALRADWDERRVSILTLVLNLVAVKLDDVPSSLPRSACREMALSIVQDLPRSLITHETLAQMVHLLTDPSAVVQKMAYGLLQGAARKRTEHLVIEAGVDIEANVKAEIPTSLLEIIQRSVDMDDHSAEWLFGYLLGWMITFDLFTDASLKVKASYIDQLRELNAINVYFIPNLFTVLNLFEGLKKAFKLDYWGVEGYYMEEYDTKNTISPQLLSAHLYYRALLVIPSLVRTWVTDCKDKQLSSTVFSYTAQHFSAVIVRAELAHVKSPAATAELVDESLTVKVASSVSEVTASYLVDEHQLEMTLKLPTDYPLHGIEIKDLKRVGVDEGKWRGWILGVQQIIGSQNGRIVDGISLFKKNVNAHFEGQVECAICYSIISVMDGSLPRKPCKTCKNRFHAGCLYKWFNTSHSSSCPLCRSDIF